MSVKMINAVAAINSAPSYNVFEISPILVLYTPLNGRVTSGQPHPCAHLQCSLNVKIIIRLSEIELGTINSCRTLSIWFRNTHECHFHYLCHGHNKEATAAVYKLF